MTGRCIVKHVGDEIWIERADPGALISRELVEAITRGDRSPWVVLDGDVLTIKAKNRTVVYRIDFEHPDEAGRWYPMQWPD